MGRPTIELNREHLAIALVHAAQGIVKLDGDRDDDNGSNLRVEGSMFLFDLLRAAAKELGADYEQMTFGEPGSI